jgi:PAS domain S-box-containing protein
VNAASEQLLVEPDMVRALLEYSREPIGLFDGESFQLVGINEPALRLLGLTAQAVGGDARRLARLWGGLDSATSAALARVLGGERVEVRVEFERADGRIIPIGSELVRLPGPRALVRMSLRDLTAEQASARALLNLANEAISVFDFEAFRIVDCNVAAERLFQRSRDELLALEDVFVLNGVPKGAEEHFRGLHRQMLERVALHGETFSGQYDALRKDGTLVPVYADVVKVPGGRALVRTSMRDLTRELEAEARYRAIFDNAPESIGVVSEEGLHEEVNPAYERLFGYQRHEARGLPVVSVIAAEQPDGRTPEQIARPIIARVLAGEVVRDRHVCRRKDGSTFRAEVQVSLIPGNPRRVLAQLTDLSERDELAARADAYQDRFRALFENAPDAIAIVNGQGLHEDVNPAYEKLMRTSRAQMRNVHPVSVVAATQPDGRTPEACVLPAMDHIRRTGKYVDRHVAQRPDGSTFPCEIQVTVLSNEPLLFRVYIADRSEAVRLEAEAAQSQARYKALIEHAPEAIVVSDAETNEPIEVNLRALELFGVTEEEFFSRSMLTFSAPIQEGGAPIAERLGELIPRVLAGETLTFKWLVQTAAGAVIPTEVRVVKLPGTRSLIRASIYDLRERERAELDARLRELTSQLNGAVFECVRPDDLSPATMTYWSDRAPELLGQRLFGRPFTPEEFVGVFHPEDGAAIVTAYRNAIAGEGLLVLEVRRVLDDGRVIWLLLQVTLSRQSDGSRVWRGFVADVSDRLRVVEMLKKADERFHALFERLPVAVVATSHDGRCQWTNPAFQVLEPVGSEFVSGFFQRWSAEDTSARVEAFFAGVDGSTGRAMVPSVAIRVSGTERLVDVHLYRDDEKGLVVLVDITEREASARALSDANQAMARANLELEAFSYSVSHDLRAPLRHIDGFSKALEEDCGTLLPAEGLEHLGRIRRATQRMGRLIDDLLRLSRVTRTEPKPQHIDVTKMCRELAEALASTYPTVQCDVQAELTVWGDEGLVRIALQNLVENAFKYSSKGARPRVEVRGEATAAGTRICVRDNGVGFDMAHAGKLFGAFQRLHREADFPGTGVGLATVQRVALRHGGTVSAEASVGEGARFRLELPGPRGGATHATRGRT